MALSARSPITSGLAALGVGAIVLTAVQPAPYGRAFAPERVVSTLGVDLAAAIDPITPWVQTITASFDNARALTALYLQQPLPLLTTIAKNQLTYLQELPNIGLIAGQMWGNVKTFFQAPYVSTPDNVSDAMVTTIEGLPISQQTVYGLLQTILDGAASPLAPLVEFTGRRIGSELQPLLEFSATPVSGELIGLLGPVVSPLIQLTESFTAIGRYWQQGEVLSALNELVNIPAHVTNAALNGGKYLDLTGVVASLGYVLPPEVKSVGLNMGGLLSVVPTAYEPPTIPESDIHPYSGGLAFDALATHVQSLLSFTDPGWPVGAIGSVIGLGQALGDAMLVTPPVPAATTAPVAAASVAAASVAAPAAIEAVDADPQTSPDAPVRSVDVDAPVASRGAEVADAATAPRPTRATAAPARGEHGPRGSARGTGRSAGGRGA